MLQLVPEQAVGLDLSDTSIEIVAVREFLNSVKVTGLGRILLEPGAVSHGDIVRPDRVMPLLQNVFASARPKPIAERGITMIIPETHLYSTIVSVPSDVAKKDVKQIVRTSGTEKIPLVREEFWDAWSEPLFTDDGAVVNYFAVPAKIITSYQKLAEVSGFKVRQFVPEQLALLNVAISDLPEEPLLILDFGGERTMLMLVDKSGVVLSASLAVGGNHLTRAIQKQLGKTLKAAEETNIENGLDPEALKGKLFLILQREIQPIMKKMTQMMAYYERRFGVQISKIILTGGGAQLKSFSEYVQSNTGRTVERVASWLSFDQAFPMLYTGALGAALQHIGWGVMKISPFEFSYD
ncbi:MAG: type IV pilus assembly protein PilM [Candidatus Magasanikbacteria bacterium]|nr:type IV pilus assembly protein PilM [Candidatus Magasanikbacteria bacterium]